jgi:signal transduction histidine kinase
VPIHAVPADAVTVVDTRLENVFAHTPAGAAIAVLVDAKHAQLTVSDGGPGFDAAGLARGSSSRLSTGLGLDIVRRIAQRSGGSMSVSRGHLGGAAVAVRFGVPDHP